MSQRILSRTQSQTINNVQSQLDNYWIPSGEKVNVYKFRQVSGSRYLTPYGELPNNVVGETQTQLFQVFTGKEPIVVVWEGSTKLEGNSNNTITQTCNIGEYETCYLSQPKELSLETKTKNLYGKDYATNIITYNISLQSNRWIPDENDIRDYFYLILDEKTKSHKWLQIDNVSLIYNESSNNFQYAEISFSNVADKYTETGKSILDFIQVKPIGDGYCFPKETHKADGSIVVELDEKKLPHNQKGANTLQLDFTSGAALSSFFCIGRKKSKLLDNNGAYTYEVDKPKILLVYDFKEPNISQFFYNQPNLNSYIMTRVQPTKEGIWKSYKDAYKGNNRIGEYNILNQKEVITGLKHSPSQVRSTNINMNTNTNWSNRVTFDIDFGSVFKNNILPYSKPIETLTRSCNYADFLNINAFANFSSDVFDYDYRETKKWKLSDTVGILGGLVNLVVGGLNIGWTTSEILKDVDNSINCIVPCISYEDGMLSLDENAPLPLDVFYDDKSQKVLPTSTNVLSSWRFRLTDRFFDSENIKENKEPGQGGGGVWDTKYLGQTKYENGEWINPDHTPLRINLKTFKPANPTQFNFDFIIDYIDFKAIASCDYRLTSYDDGNNPLYYYIGETNGKARGDIRIWGNSMKLNFWDKYNTDGEINYPIKPISPTPDKDLVGIDLPILNNNELTINETKWIHLSNFPNLVFEKKKIKKGGGCGPVHCYPTYYGYEYLTNWPANNELENKNYNLIGFNKNNEYKLKTNIVNYIDKSVFFPKIGYLLISFNDKRINDIVLEIQEKNTNIIKITKTINKDLFLSELWQEEIPENKYVARYFESGYLGGEATMSYKSNATNEFLGFDVYCNLKDIVLYLELNILESKISTDIEFVFDMINLMKITNNNQNPNKVVKTNHFYSRTSFNYLDKYIKDHLTPKIDLTIESIKIFYK